MWQREPQALRRTQAVTCHPGELRKGLAEGVKHSGVEFQQWTLERFVGAARKRRHVQVSRGACRLRAEIVIRHTQTRRVSHDFVDRMPALLIGLHHYEAVEL